MTPEHAEEVAKKLEAFIDKKLKAYDNDNHQDNGASGWFITTHEEREELVGALVQAEGS